ncbi:MAG: hypothetical protein AAFX87_09565 [Bacteroidota bacterium]
MVDQLTSKGWVKAQFNLESKGELLIIKAENISSVRQLFKRDPALNEGYLIAEITPWDLRYGTLCEKNKNTAQRYVLARYVSILTKESVRRASQEFEAHDQYLNQIKKTGNVVAEGIFTNSDGGLLVMKGDVGDALIFSDPAVQSGFLEAEIFNVVLKKGSICQ